MSKILSFTAFLGFLSVLLGAFGAHILKEKLDVGALNNFETGVKYQMFHVLAILLIYSFQKIKETHKLRISFIFILGILCFSGSLYVIAIGFVKATNIWFVTPLGGLLFLIGWMYLSIVFFRKRYSN